LTTRFDIAKAKAMAQLEQVACLSRESLHKVLSTVRCQSGTDNVRRIKSTRVSIQRQLFAIFWLQSVKPQGVLAMNEEILSNPVTGESMRILESTAQTFKVQYSLRPRKERRISVLSGEMGVRINGEPIGLRLLFGVLGPIAVTLGYRRQVDKYLVHRLDA